MKDYFNAFLLAVREHNISKLLTEDFPEFDKSVTDDCTNNADQAMQYYYRGLKVVLNRCRKEKVNYRAMSDKWDSKLMTEYYKIANNIKDNMDSDNTLDLPKDDKHASYGLLFTKIISMPLLQQLYAWDLFTTRLSPNFFRDL